ncbi:phospholipid-transporting ATPase 2-like protein [Tanacetum coccineum]
MNSNSGEWTSAAATNTLFPLLPSATLDVTLHPFPSSDIRYPGRNSVDIIKFHVLQITTKVSYNGLKENAQDVAFVINGWALKIDLKYYRKAFKEFAILSRTAICCRVTPSQKAQLVELLKSYDYRTLAIGDGGNDVPLLRWKRIPVLAAPCLWSVQGAIVLILFHLHAQSQVKYIGHFLAKLAMDDVDDEHEDVLYPPPVIETLMMADIKRGSSRHRSSLKDQDRNDRGRHRSSLETRDKDNDKDMEERNVVAERIENEHDMKKSRNRGVKDIYRDNNREREVKDRDKKRSHDRDVKRKSQ